MKLHIHSQTSKASWRLGIDKQFHHIFYNRCDYLSMLLLKFTIVNKRDPWKWQYRYDKHTDGNLDTIYP